MNSFHEKLFFGATTLVSSGFSLLGAIVTTGEARWLYVTLAASSMMSGFLALMFKGEKENVRVLVGRCGFAILGGILATQPVAQWLGLESSLEENIIRLAGLASATTIATFFFGYGLLLSIERRAPALAEKWLKKNIP